MAPAMKRALATGLPLEQLIRSAVERKLFVRVPPQGMHPHWGRGQIVGRELKTRVIVNVFGNAVKRVYAFEELTPWTSRNVQAGIQWPPLAGGLLRKASIETANEMLALAAKAEGEMLFDSTAPAPAPVPEFPAVAEVIEASTPEAPPAGPIAAAPAAAPAARKKVSWVLFRDGLIWAGPARRWSPDPEKAVHYQKTEYAHRAKGHITDDGGRILVMSYDDALDAWAATGSAPLAPARAAGSHVDVVMELRAAQDAVVEAELRLGEAKHREVCARRAVDAIRQEFEALLGTAKADGAQ